MLNNKMIKKAERGKIRCEIEMLLLFLNTFFIELKEFNEKELKTKFENKKITKWYINFDKDPKYFCTGIMDLLTIKYTLEMASYHFVRLFNIVKFLDAHDSKLLEDNFKKDENEIIEWDKYLLEALCICEFNEMNGENYVFKYEDVKRKTLALKNKIGEG